MFLRIGIKFGPIVDVALIDGELHVVIEVVHPYECDGERIALRVADLRPFAQAEVRMWIETTRMPA